MNIVEKIKNKQASATNPPVTIAFIGDSITQGCFEVYYKTPTQLDTVYEYNNAFPTRLREMLALLYPSVQINIINSGISGDAVSRGLKRLDRDVLSYHPDLVVVGYGANDCNLGGDGGVTAYREDLREMFRRIKDTGAEVIYLTEGPFCTKTSPTITDDRLKSLAEKFSDLENRGVLARYFSLGKEVANEEGVECCDVYSAWKALENAGVDTTELLANKLNHPSRDMHYYIAIKLLETMLK